MNAIKRSKIPVIYFIDDDRFYTEPLRKALEYEFGDKIDMHYFNTCTKAKEMIQKEKNIDIIILDIMMPPENTYTLKETEDGISTGLKLLQDIRQIEKHKQTRVIVITARRSNDIELIDECYKNSVKEDDVMHKPIILKEFIKKVRGYIEEVVK